MAIIRDQLFCTDAIAAGAFEFDKSVSSVFDDMVSRSVPCYQELQDSISDLFGILSKSRVALDIGCSTGSTIDRILNAHVDVKTLYGLDLSEPMLDAARLKLHKYPDKVCLKSCNLVTQIFIEGWEADFAIINLVLQFVRPIDRGSLMKNLLISCPSLKFIILVEKIVFDEGLINQAFIKAYYAMKARNGYSDNEIHKKRMALENKLIPYTHAENLEIMKVAGFAKSEVFYSHLNFRGYLFYRD